MLVVDPRAEFWLLTTAAVGRLLTAGREPTAVGHFHRVGGRSVERDPVTAPARVRLRNGRGQGLRVGMLRVAYEALGRVFLDEPSQIRDRQSVVDSSEARQVT